MKIYEKRSLFFRVLRPGHPNVKASNTSAERGGAEARIEDSRLVTNCPAAL